MCLTMPRTALLEPEIYPHWAEQKFLGGEITSLISSYLEGRCFHFSSLELLGCIGIMSYSIGAT